MLAAEPDELDVGEAEPDRVDTHEDLVSRRSGDRNELRPPVASDALDPLAIHVPGERLRGHVLRECLVGGVPVLDVDHFGRGKSAFFSTRPDWSMIPTFVPIVSGLAEKRSPALIATQR